MLRDIFVTQNALLEKNDGVYNLVYDLLGDSFVMTKSDEVWKLKRKICAHAFYKEKLEAMTEVMRNVTLDKIEHFNKLVTDNTGKAAINLTSELSELYTRIIISICFGEDLTDSIHNFINPDGSISKLSLHYALRGIFIKLI
jgi:cytochrome P450